MPLGDLSRLCVEEANLLVSRLPGYIYASVSLAVCCSFPVDKDGYGIMPHNLEGWCVCRGTAFDIAFVAPPTDAMGPVSDPCPLP